MAVISPISLSIIIDILVNKMVFLRDTAKGGYSMRPIDIPQIAELSKPEKILFVEELWDEISEEDDDIAIPESHKRELNRRFLNHQKMPNNLLTLEELQTRIEKRK